MTYKLPSGLASFEITDCDEWTLPGRAADRNKALREALKECHRLQSERDALVTDAARFNWVAANVTESVVQNGNEYVALKTKYQLPFMVAYADFCGQISFADAVDIKMRGDSE